MPWSTVDPPGAFTAFVEACYAPHATGDGRGVSDDEWLVGIAAAAKSPLRAARVAAIEFRTHAAGVEIVRATEGPFVLGEFIGTGRLLPPEFLRAYVDFDVATLRDFLSAAEFRELRNTFGAPFTRFDRDEACAIQGRSSPTSGVLIVSFRRDNAHLSAGRIGYLRRAAAHLRAAARLRLHRSEIEAVLDPSGRVVHAEGPAKARGAHRALAVGAKIIERARAKRTLDGFEAWHALWNGRWTLVDSFDRDGKRWLLARANHSLGPALGALQPRERDVVSGVAAGRPLKLIAYELGLPLSTVASTLRRAMRKLRVGSRAELASLAASLPSLSGE
ncbi:MAG: LuxR C-terminal-related transcriptional regulator [Polyangiaceae bacterium]